MPYPRFPTVFLSCSFEPTDVVVYSWFHDLLESLEFRVLSGKEPSTRPLPDVVRHRIQEAASFVGVLTRRDAIGGSSEWMPPGWVRDELAIARSLSKPVAVLAEDGVRVDGVIPLDAKYERWDRTDFGKAAPLVVRFLVALRNEVSPASEDSGDLATIRALYDEVSDLATWISDVEQTLKASGWTLAMLTARTTGRLFTLPQGLQEKVTDAYSAVSEVDEVLHEMEEPRRALKPKRGAGFLDFSPGPPLPPEHPLCQKLHAAVESSQRRILVALGALFNAGYPRELAEMQRRLAKMPDGPAKDAARVFLEAFLGEPSSTASPPAGSARPDGR